MKVDKNNDGKISDNELEVIRLEEAAEKSDTQARMAWVSLIAILVFTAFLFMPFVPDSRIKLLSELSAMFYVVLAGITGAYVGVSTWMKK